MSDLCVNEKVMWEYRNFVDLPKINKLAIAENDGIFLSKTEDEMHYIHLHYLDGFFVEIYHEAHTFAVCEIKAFFSNHLINKYKFILDDDNFEADSN